MSTAIIKEDIPVVIERFTELEKRIYSNPVVM